MQDINIMAHAGMIMIFQAHFIRNGGGHAADFCGSGNVLSSFFLLVYVCRRLHYTRSRDTRLQSCSLSDIRSEGFAILSVYTVLQDQVIRSASHSAHFTPADYGALCVVCKRLAQQCAIVPCMHGCDGRVTDV